jgi:hypothetical protein
LSVIDVPLIKKIVANYFQIDEFPSKADRRPSETTPKRDPLLPHTQRPHTFPFRVMKQVVDLLREARLTAAHSKHSYTPPRPTTQAHAAEQMQVLDEGGHHNYPYRFLGDIAG